MLFHIPHNVFQFVAVRADDHVDMTGHDAPAVNFQSFMLLVMLPAFKQNVLVFISDKKVYPPHNGKAYKVKPLLVPEFIFGAH